MRLHGIRLRDTAKGTTVKTVQRNGQRIEKAATGITGSADAPGVIDFIHTLLLNSAKGAEYVDDMTDIIEKNHTIKLSQDVRRLELDIKSPQSRREMLGFYGAYTSQAQNKKGAKINNYNEKCVITKGVSSKSKATTRRTTDSGLLLYSRKSYYKITQGINRIYSILDEDWNINIQKFEKSWISAKSKHPEQSAWIPPIEFIELLLCVLVNSERLRTISKIHKPQEQQIKLELQILLDTKKVDNSTCSHITLVLLRIVNVLALNNQLIANIFSHLTI